VLNSAMDSLQRPSAVSKEAKGVRFGTSQRTQALEQRSILGKFSTAINGWFFGPSVGRRGSAR
jgi:hypothetical protein